MSEQVNIGDVVRVTHPRFRDFKIEGAVAGVFKDDGDIRFEGSDIYLETLFGSDFQNMNVEVIRRAKRELPTEEGVYYPELPNEQKGSSLTHKRLFKRKFDGWFDVADEAQTEKTKYLEELVNSEYSPWTLVRLVPEQQ